MIDLYKKTNLNYTSNGDIIVHATICNLKFKENEVYLEVPVTDDSGWEYVDYDDVIGVYDNGKKKFFRIYNVIKSTYKIVAYCRPLFYDLVNSILINKTITNKNGQDALSDILTGTGFKAHSDIPTINNLNYVRKNIVESLVGDDENSFINVYGGELYVENWDVYINNKIGSDNGVVVEFGYNLEEIEYDINTDEICTRIIPIGVNGIMLNGDEPWISSKNLNKYPYPKTRVIEFDVKVKENPDDEEGFNTLEEAQAELIKKCEELFMQGIDQPTANFNINMINLANTTAYKDIEPLVSVNGGDIVTVNCEHLGINRLKVRVIDYEKDLLTGNYISIELGDSLNNFLYNQIDIQHRVNNITNDDGSVKAESLQGTIDAHNALFKATKDVAQPMDVLGILFEDKVQGSPTFGSVAISSQGLMMADKFKPGTETWDYRTFITGSGAVADRITTGTMLADRVRAGLLESQNKTTWINLNDGTYNFADKVEFDGTNLIINAKNFQTDAQGNITFTGRLQPNDYQLKLFGNECLIDGSANAIRLQFNPQIYMAVDNLGAFRLFNQNSNGGRRYTSIFMGTDGHTQLYNNTTMLKLLGSGTPEVQARNSGDTGFAGFAGNAFRNMSSRKYKTNIENPNIDYLKVLKENSVKKYQLKDDIDSGDKLGFILEDLTDEAKKYLNPNGTEGIDIYSMCSMLWGIVQEQQKQIEELKGGI